MAKDNKWALILGIINVIYFLVAWGVGWLPGMTGWVDADSLFALIIGFNLMMFYFLTK